MMAHLLRRLHTWLGLLTFVNLMVYGVVGISAAWQLRPRARFGTPKTVSLPYDVSPGLSDAAVADRVCTLLGLTLARPIQSAVIQHDAAHHLVLDFWHANGRHKVTVLEREGRLQVEVFPVTLARYLDTLHLTTAAFRSGDWRMRLWAGYNEFALWALIGMLATGAALWLVSRPRHRMAQLSLAAGCAIFAALYLWSR